MGVLGEPTAYIVRPDEANYVRWTRAATPTDGFCIQLWTPPVEVRDNPDPNAQLTAADFTSAWPVAGISFPGERLICYVAPSAGRYAGLLRVDVYRHGRLVYTCANLDRTGLIRLIQDRHHYKREECR